MTAELVKLFSVKVEKLNQCAIPDQRPIAGAPGETQRLCKTLLSMQDTAGVKIAGVL